ncbi:hypothetical protein HY478_03860, partial [Candidatus Uhrbacteria bacterium]|nr:hypothetical protein [Candidatus Uhrbacteria bacterium]
MRLIIARGVLSSLLLYIVFGISHTTYAADFTSTSYQVLEPVMNAGGYATSSNFTLVGSIAGLVHDIASTTSFAFNPGFPAYPFVSTPAIGAAAGNAQVALTWTASEGFVGWSVSGYDVGQSTVSGGPYTYSSVGNVTSSTRTGLTNGTTYYFVVNPKDSFGNRIGTSTQASATPAAPAGGGGDSGGGGGGGGGGALPSTGSVTFFGRAYPKSSVTILKDAQVAATTITGTDASFLVTLTNLSAGNYIFSIYSEDKDGYRSALMTFPTSITTGVTTDISGIFIAPTIAADKSEVRRGDTIAIFGQAAPKADIVIEVNSDEQFFGKTISDNSGVYLYNFDSSILENGSHAARSKAAIGNQLVSGFSSPVAFKVGTRNILATKAVKSSAIGDLNSDRKVNLIDFSILAYWYNRTLSTAGTKADLNR